MHFQKWTLKDLGSSLKPNYMDYKKVRLYYDCNDNEGAGFESKLHESLSKRFTGTH